jgi:hypothetical protein
MPLTDRDRTPELEKNLLDSTSDNGPRLETLHTSWGATPRRQVLFQLPDAGLPYRAALIASLAGGAAIDDATVILVGLRRDPRLE